MKGLLAALLAVAAVVSEAPAQTASPMGNVAGPHTTPGVVSRVILYRIKPGMADAFWSDVRTHLVPIYEEYKKRGLITNYSYFSKATSDSDRDWDVGLTLSYANWGALDTFSAANTDPVTLGHYGSAANRTAANNARGGMREVMQSFLTRSQTPNPTR